MYDGPRANTGPRTSLIIVYPAIYLFRSELPSTCIIDQELTLGQEPVFMYLSIYLSRSELPPTCMMDQELILGPEPVYVKESATGRLKTVYPRYIFIHICSI